MKCTCTLCQKNFIKADSQVKKSKSGNHFCSRTCAATYNNKVYIKRKIANRCTCGEKIPRTGKQCQRCHLVKYLLDNKTLGEATAHRKGPCKYINIRKAARRIYLKSDRPKCCLLCGYDKHFDVAHVKPIAKFRQDSLISTINDLSNLAALCPNHHWELDHDLMKIGPVGIEPTSFGL